MKDAADFLDGYRKDESALFDQIFIEMLPRLRSLAHFYLRRERPDATLRTTALVNELYVSLRTKLDQKAIDHEDVARITGALTRQMLYIIYDQFDRKSAQKRGAGQIRVSVEAGDVVDANLMRSLPLLDAQRELQRLYPRIHNIFFLHYEFGYTMEELTALLGVSTTTIHREIKFAKSFLKANMGGHHALFTDRFIDKPASRRNVSGTRPKAKRTF